MQDSKLSYGKRSNFMLDEISTNQKIQRQKIILTLEELNYLTVLFSLLARVHLMNPTQYELLKEWILSTKKSSKIKEDESNQTLIIRKLLS
jgi:hypothetical protein